MNNIQIQNLQPAPGLILIQIDKVENTSKRGLLLPEMNGLPQTGVVKAIGKDTEKNKCPVTVGQRVLYEKYTLNDFSSGEDNFRVIRFENVLGTIKETK